jgi:hypothetical protein
MKNEAVDRNVKPGILDLQRMVYESPQKLSPTEVAVLLGLIDHHPNIHPSFARLSARTRCSISTIRRTLKRLENRGAILVHRRLGVGQGGRNETNEYTINMIFLRTHLNVVQPIDDDNGGLTVSDGWAHSEPMDGLTVNSEVTMEKKKERSMRERAHTRVTKSDPKNSQEQRDEGKKEEKEKGSEGSNLNEKIEAFVGRLLAHYPKPAVEERHVYREARKLFTTGMLNDENSNQVFKALKYQIQEGILNIDKPDYLPKPEYWLRRFNDIDYRDCECMCDPRWKKIVDRILSSWKSPASAKKKRASSAKAKRERYIDCL